MLKVCQTLTSLRSGYVCQTSTCQIVFKDNQQAFANLFFENGLNKGQEKKKLVKGQDLANADEGLIFIGTNLTALVNTHTPNQSGCLSSGQVLGTVDYVSEVNVLCPEVHLTLRPTKTSFFLSRLVRRGQWQRT